MVTYLTCVMNILIIFKQLNNKNDVQFKSSFKIDLI